MIYQIQKAIVLITFISLWGNVLTGQNYFNRIIEFDDAVPLPAEVIQITTDSFIINTKTILNLKESNTIISYDALLDDYSRYDFQGINPNRRSLLRIKDHYYLYATNTNEINDSLTLIKMNQQFEILEQTDFPSPETLMHQSRVLEINHSIYGASAYDPIGDQTRMTHFKKIDASGDVIWTENYFNDLRGKGDSDYTVTPDKHILSSNAIRFDIFNTFPQVVKTDTMGNVIWRYDHDQETESTVSIVVNLSDGNIMFTLVEDLSINEDVMKFIWVDENGSFLKEKLILPYEQYESLGYYNFVEGNGDYFFGHGGYRENADDSIYQESYGLVTKFNNAGELIWTHRYKHPDYTLNEDNYNFVDLKEEDNGDLVVLGQITRFSDPSAFKVWLFRVDSTGCPDPAYCDEFINFTSTQETSPVYKDITVFPNPANQHVYIELPDKNQSGILEIISSVGTIVQSKIIQNSSVQIEMDVSDFPAGLYYVKFRNRKENIIYRSSFIVME